MHLILERRKRGVITSDVITHGWRIYGCQTGNAKSHQRKDQGKVRHIIVRKGKGVSRSLLRVG